jgi:hypothetical protein
VPEATAAIPEAGCGTAAARAQSAETTAAIQVMQRELQFF